MLEAVWWSLGGGAVEGFKNSRSIAPQEDLLTEGFRHRIPSNLIGGQISWVWVVLKHTINM
jgi:hypothetical protein